MDSDNNATGFGRPVRRSVCIFLIVAAVVSAIAIVGVLSAKNMTSAVRLAAGISAYLVLLMVLGLGAHRSGRLGRKLLSYCVLAANVLVATLVWLISRYQLARDGIPKWSSLNTIADVCFWLVVALGMVVISVSVSGWLRYFRGRKRLDS